jgi:hypothetical protein
VFLKFLYRVPRICQTETTVLVLWQGLERFMDNSSSNFVEHFG